MLFSLSFDDEREILAAREEVALLGATGQQRPGHEEFHASVLRRTDQVAGEARLIRRALKHEIAEKTPRLAKSTGRRLSGSTMLKSQSSVP